MDELTLPRRPTIALIDGAVASWPGTLTRFGAHGHPAQTPATRHAQAMIDAIRTGWDASGSHLINVVIFQGALRTDVGRLIEALDRLQAWPGRIDLVHCSFGLPRPDAALITALDALVERVGVVVASAPARGVRVWPAAHPRVVSVQGDARCTEDQWSHLALPWADFGASPRAGPEDQPAGASLAAARFSGLLIKTCVSLRLPDAGMRMVLQASFRGRERRRS